MKAGLSAYLPTYLCESWENQVLLTLTEPVWPNDSRKVAKTKKQFQIISTPVFNNPNLV